MTERFQVAHNPDPESSLPFLVRLPVEGETLVLRSRHRVSRVPRRSPATGRTRAGGTKVWSSSWTSTWSRRRAAASLLLTGLTTYLGVVIALGRTDLAVGPPDDLFGNTFVLIGALFVAALGAVVGFSFGATVLPAALCESWAVLGRSRRP